MIHLGDITKINGGEAPVVDVVIGGSPCQDYAEFGITRTFPLPENGQGLPGRVPACIWSKYGLSRR